MAFVYDHFPEVEQIIRTSKETGAALNEAARAVQRHAKTGGHIPGRRRLSERKKSIRYWSSRVRTVDGEETQAALVTSYDNLAVIFEYGSLNSPPYRIFENAVRAAGLDFDAEGPPGLFDISNIAGSYSDTTLDG